MKQKLCYLFAFLWLFTCNVAVKAENGKADEIKPLKYYLVDYTRNTGVWKCFYDDSLLNIIEEQFFTMPQVNCVHDHIFTFSVSAIRPGHGFLNFSFFENETAETPILYLDISYEINDLLEIVCTQTMMVLYEEDTWVE